MKRFSFFLALLGHLAASPALAQDSVTFGTAIVQAGPHTLSVELATTPEQLEHGLMFRKVLPQGSGMLFLFSPPREVAMWMKNTFIPLDMVFVDWTGLIIRIEENAMPHSLRIIESGEETAAVLELPAGDAKRLGLEPGMSLIWTIPLPEMRN